MALNNGSKKLLSSKFSLIGGIIILFFLGFNLANTWRQNNSINNEISQLEGEIINLEKTNIELSELINYLNSTAYVEKKAREDLGLKKVGEQTVIIPDASGLINASAGQNYKNDSDINNLQKWWRYFFKPQS